MACSTGDKQSGSLDAIRRMVEDILVTLERVHKHTEEDVAEEREDILSIQFPGEQVHESRRPRSFPIGSDSRVLQSKETANMAVGPRVERVVEHLVMGQKRIMKMCEIIQTQGDETRAMLDFVKEMTKALRAETFDTPRLACLLSPWDFEEPRGLSQREQDPQTWTRKVQHESARGRGWFTEEMRVFLVCAKTHRLVPCGLDGHGYQITEVRDWVKRAFGVVRVMVELTSLVLGVGAAAGVVSNLAQAVGSGSEVVRNEELFGLKERYPAFTVEEQSRENERRQATYPGDMASMET